MEDKKSRTAYALYFKKFVESYQDLGIDLFAIMARNEPNWDSNNYLACGYSPEGMYDFLKNYLVPAFESGDVNCDIWHGTLIDKQHGINLGDNYVANIMNDKNLADKIKGIGIQYGLTERVADVR